MNGETARETACGESANGPAFENGIVCFGFFPCLCRDRGLLFLAVFLCRGRGRGLGLGLGLGRDREVGRGPPSRVARWQ